MRRGTGAARSRARLVTLAVVALAATSCSGTDPDAGPAEPGSPATTAPTGPEVRVSEELVRLTEPHEETGMTLLEGPVFRPDGDLLVVDVTAPPGAPKVIAVDVATGGSTTVATDADSVWTSAQISPHDGRLYLTDFLAGTVDSMTVDGQDPQVFAGGPVDGVAMQPDDIAFDEQGNAYVSDTTGFDQPLGEPRGRVVRIDHRDGAAGVIAAGLPAPNGISFTADFGALLVSQYAANRIDHLGLTEDGSGLRSSHPAVHVDTGAAQVDSNAVDADGNVYQGYHLGSRLTVHSPTGEHLGTIDVPVPTPGAYSTTNLAIRPGTTEAYLTVSGPSGGYVHSFEAFGEGIRQSNGG